MPAVRRYTYAECNCYNIVVTMHEHEMPRDGSCHCNSHVFVSFMNEVGLRLIEELRRPHVYMVCLPFPRELSVT